MSLHKSLRAGNAMGRHRNVLTRFERLGRLETQKRWSEEEDSIFGLPMVRNAKLVTKKKKKKEAEPGAAGETAAASAAGTGAPAAT